MNVLSIVSLYGVQMPQPLGRGDGGLTADLGMGGQIFLSAEGSGASGARVHPLAGVHGRQVAVQVGAVAEVLEAVDALHELPLQVDGLLVTVGVGLEGEAGGALGAAVARRRRVERRAGRQGAVEAVQRQGHERERVAVLVLSQLKQAAKQLLTQRAGQLPPPARPSAPYLRHTRSMLLLRHLIFLDGVLDTLQP